MPVRRNASFGTYFFVGFIGMLIGSVIGNVLVKNIFQPGAITKLINLYGFANKLILRIGGYLTTDPNGSIRGIIGAGGYTFNLNLIALLGIILAIYIYRRV